MLVTLCGWVQIPSVSSEAGATSRQSEGQVLVNVSISMFQEIEKCG
jgi:hypothetical protein